MSDCGQAHVPPPAPQLIDANLPVYSQILSSHIHILLSILDFFIKENQN